jgi:cytochrome c peroxidase
MNIKFKMIFLGILLTALAVNCGPSKETKELMKQAASMFGAVPDKMPGSEKDTPDKIALGKKLYFEKKLSKNDSQSCNDCHMLGAGKGGVDNQPTSTGAFGEKGGRNSPTVFNAGFQIAQFWDGRAADLVEQAKGPILNPVEMAMPDQKATVAKIKAIAEYPPMFKKAFPNAKPGKEVTYNKIAKAIAAFERTLVTKDRFDAFIKGDAKALTKEEQKGLKLFISTGCSSCHNGPTLGGKMYMKLGVVKPWPDIKDTGRFEVTKNEADKFVFKVPMLRNVGNTAPYFHDGSVANLKKAVRKMAKHQLGKKLAKDEVTSIVAFLHTMDYDNPGIQ